MITINRPKGKPPVRAEILNPYIQRTENNVVVINREEAMEVVRKIAGKKPTESE